MSGEQPAPAAPESSGYLRVLSRFDATILVIGSIIGAGIFFTPNDIAHVVQSRPAMLAVWVLGGVIALTGALVYAELGGLFPATGGVYVFLREAFGGLPAFLYGWALILVIVPGALALVAGFFAANLVPLLPWSSPGTESAIALAVLISLTLVNIRGVRLGSTLQNVVTVAKLVVFALLVGAGLFYRGEPLALPAGQVAPAPTHVGFVGVLFAMMPALFSYGGWQNGTYIAGEMKRPQRDIPFAVICGTLVVIGVYVSINFAYLRVLSPEAIAGDRRFAALAAHTALGSAGGSLVTAGILVSTFGICAAMLLTNPRVAQAIGADGLFFAAFGRLHPRFRTPHWAIGVLGAWSCVLYLIGAAGQLLHSVVFADWIFFAAIGATLFLFRCRLPDAERPYRCPLYPWLPGLFFVLATAMAVITFVQSDLTSRLLGPGILIAGVPVFWAFRRSQAGRA
jgi:APA family basic amino acid/polyamine antiporter